MTSSRIARKTFALATTEDSPLKKQTTSESLEFNNLVQEVEREISADRKQVERTLPVVLETAEMEEAVADDREEVAGGETSRVSATSANDEREQRTSVRASHVGDSRVETAHLVTADGERIELQVLRHGRQMQIVGCEAGHYVSVACMGFAPKSTLEQNNTARIENETETTNQNRDDSLLVDPPQGQRTSFNRADVTEVVDPLDVPLVVRSSGDDEALAAWQQARRQPSRWMQRKHGWSAMAALSKKFRQRKRTSLRPKAGERRNATIPS